MGKGHAPHWQAQCFLPLVQKREQGGEQRFVLRLAGRPWVHSKLSIKGVVFPMGQNQSRCLGLLAFVAHRSGHLAH